MVTPSQSTFNRWKFPTEAPSEDNIVGHTVDNVVSSLSVWVVSDKSPAIFTHTPLTELQHSLIFKKESFLEVIWAMPEENEGLQISALQMALLSTASYFITTLSMGAI